MDGILKKIVIKEKEENNIDEDPNENNQENDNENSSKKDSNKGHSGSYVVDIKMHEDNT